jgi:hypothetical protein
MLLKKSATVYIARFAWDALPLTEARERLVGRSERSIFWPAVGNQLPRLNEMAAPAPRAGYMEACAGAHYMARKLATLGHNVKQMSPQFVRPFVKDPNLVHHRTTRSPLIDRPLSVGTAARRRPSSTF